MKKVYDPMLGEKLNYLWFSHSRPWRLSVGKLVDTKIVKGCIRASFELNRADAKENMRWDAENQRIMLELLDADGRVVIENWIDFTDRTRVCADLCLGDPNVLDRFM